MGPLQVLPEFFPGQSGPKSNGNEDCWLVGFYGISTFVGYLMPNHSYATSQLYFKQFSLARVQFVKTLLIQLIQFSISTDFVYTQLNVKTVLY